MKTIGVISSDPLTGSTIHGLTLLGQKQSQDSAQNLIDQLEKDNLLHQCKNLDDFNDKVLFFSSNFTRARQTAEGCIQSIQSLLMLKYPKDVNSWGRSFIGQDVCGSKYNDDPFEEQIDKPDSWEAMKQRIDTIERQSKSYIIRNELRERYFGNYDAKELKYYANVWPLDWEDANNNESGVESVNQVISRLKPFFR